MSYSNLELMQRIFEMFADELEFYSGTGVVISVDEENKTCRVKLDNDEPDIHKVKYVVNASSNQGMQMKPKVDSQVAIAYITNDVGIVTQMQEFETLTFDAGESTVAQATKTAEKLVQVEELCNSIIDALANSATGTQDGGLAYKNALALALGAEKIFVVTEESDINYDKIKIP